MAALARRGIIRPPRGPFAFPGTKPGFDPNHIAGRATRISVVPTGANFVNLMTGGIGTRSGAGITASLRSGLGPGVVAAANTDFVTFAGMPAVSDANVTCAAIVDHTALATGGIFCAHSTDSSWGFYYSTAITSYGIRANGNAAATPSPTLVPSANVPYFLVWSGVAGTNTPHNILMMRMDTGQISTSSYTASVTPNASDGTYRIGNLSATAARHQGNIAAVMFSAKSLSLPEMRAWANDPWSFWYPR